MGSMFKDAITFNQPLYIANVHTTLTIRLGGTDWQTRIINNDTSNTNIQYWGYDNQWWYDHGAPNYIAQQFRFFAAYVCAYYNITSGSASVYHGSGYLGPYSFTYNGGTSYTGTYTGQYYNEGPKTWNYTLPTNISINRTIDSWNTGNVINMSNMFNNARAFNQAIDSWNTAKVTTMQGMFQNASAFNQPISAWKTNSVTDMGSMFKDAITFNQPLYIANVHTTLTIRLGRTDWQTRIINNDTSQVNIQNWNPDSQWFQPLVVPDNEVALQFRFFAAYVTTFYGVTSASATVFSGSGNLGVYSFTRISETRYSATFSGFYGDLNQLWDYTLSTPISINRTIGSWNTDNVINMSNMFNNAREFDKPIITFNTANVTNMGGMFANAFKFNQPIGSWNTAKVTTMQGMFQNASAFKQNISSWKVYKLTSKPNKPTDFDTNATALLANPSNLPNWAMVMP
jgi:surface protein